MIGLSAPHKSRANASSEKRVATEERPAAAMAVAFPLRNVLSVKLFAFSTPTSAMVRRSCLVSGGRLRRVKGGGASGVVEARRRCRGAHQPKMGGPRGDSPRQPCMARDGSQSEWGCGVSVFFFVPLTVYVVRPVRDLAWGLREGAGSHGLSG